MGIVAVLLDDIKNFDSDLRDKMRSISFVEFGQKSNYVMEKFETLMLSDAIFKGKSRAQSSGRPGSGPSCLEMLANPLSTKIGLTFI